MRAAATFYVGQVRRRADRKVMVSPEIEDVSTGGMRAERVSSKTWVGP